MKKKILVIEDNLDHIKSIAQHLRQYDLMLTRYYSEALKIAIGEKPDLIITDWELQSEAGDGIDIIQQLKQHKETAHIPIIMATAFTSSDKLEQAFEAGAVDYIRKPFSEKELLARVRSVLLLYSVPSQQQSLRNKLKVLLLGANPRGTALLDVDVEFSTIKNNLTKLGRERANFEVSIELSVTKSWLLQAFLDERPNIVHFSGHGKEGALLLHDDRQYPEPLENFHSLINIFGEKHPIDCVVLNSCHSASIIERIEKIPVIGINGAIRDNLAVMFSEGFYKAISSGEDLYFAYRFGLIAANANENEIVLKNYH